MEWYYIVFLIARWDSIPGFKQWTTEQILRRRKERRDAVTADPVRGRRRWELAPPPEYACAGPG